MKSIKKSILFILLFLFLISCSDGMQVSQKLNLLISENKIEKIIILSECNSAVNDKLEFTVKKIKIDNQFLINGKSHYNLNHVKQIELKAKTLELVF